LTFDGTDKAALSVTGGLFSGALEVNLLSGASMSFIGSGLLYDPSSGLLRGTLEDGSAISSLMTFDNFPTSYQYGYAPDGAEILTFVGVQSVPEPSSIVTLLIGTAAVAIVFVRMRLRRDWLARAFNSN
jgi:hypothetical protein